MAAHSETYKTFEEALAAVTRFETETSTKYAVYKASKNFGSSDDIRYENHQVVFHDENGVSTGIPCMQIGKKIMECHRGKNRRIGNKSKNNQALTSDHAIGRKNKIVQNTKKAGCTARIVMKDLVIFPQHKIDKLSEWKRRLVSKQIKKSLKNGGFEGQRQFVVVFPAVDDHDANCTTKAAGICLPVDGRILKHIQHLVENGVRSVTDMRIHVLQYVQRELFPDGELPPRPNRRYFPTNNDIQNAMYRGIVKNRLSNIDQQNLQQHIPLWKERRPEDQFFFRPHSVNSPDSVSDDLSETNDLDDDVRIVKQTNDQKNLLFVHQSADQRHLVARYGNELCLLDATYRTTRYSLPLFFIGVKTNSGYFVVASFVTQDETKTSISEALQVIKSWNPNWSPRFFMTDYCQEEIQSVEEVFTGCKVYLCDFHREQAWSRWLKKIDHGVHSKAGEILSFIRQIARSSSEQIFTESVDSLKKSDVWNSSLKLRNWFNHKWLTCSERWVFAFRKDRFLVNVNTNNGIERQNETFKHTYLQRHRNKTLSQMVKTLVEDYLPDQYEKYIEHNVKFTDGYRKYSDSIPAFLHNRPREFVLACMERIYLAENIPRCNINWKPLPSNKQVFTVASQSSSSKEYNICLGNETILPSCTCYDWQHTFTPCKHMMSVILKFEDLSWEHLSPLYRQSVFLTVDETVIKTSDSTREKGDFYHEVEQIEGIEDEIQSLPAPNRTRGLAAECRETLKHLLSLTYLVTDQNCFITIKDQLQSVRNKMNDNIPKESGLLLETDSKPAAKHQNTKNDFLHLPTTKRKHPFSGRIGTKADIMKRQYQCTLPLPSADNQPPLKTVSEELPDLLLCPEISTRDTSDDDIIVTGESKVNSFNKQLNRKLLPINLNRLKSNRMLDDMEINIAQNILKQQFPEVLGLEDTTLGPCRQFSVFNGPFVQILHDGGLHWVAISNFGCKEGDVQYFDSLNTSGIVKPEVQRLISSVMFTESPEINIRICPVQQQKNGIDCGVFAIAFITAILHGENPDMCIFDPAQLRSHLIQCLTSQTFRPFPTVKNSKLKAVKRCKKRDISMKIFCKCRMPWSKEDLLDTNLDMAECEKCKTWFHRRCDKIPENVFTSKAHWQCTTCKDIHAGS